jgi:hypothetical protein
MSWLCNQSFKKPIKVKIFIFWFYCDFCFQVNRVELSKESGPSFFKILWVASYTQGSKSNIPCCALLPRQVRATFASDSRMWRVNPAWIWRICHAMLCGKFAYDVRHVARVHHANVARTCRAQQGMLLLDPSVYIYLRISLFQAPRIVMLKCGQLNFLSDATNLCELVE